MELTASAIRIIDGPALLFPFWVKSGSAHRLNCLPCGRPVYLKGPAVKSQSARPHRALSHRRCGHRAWVRGLSCAAMTWAFSNVRRDAGCPKTVAADRRHAVSARLRTMRQAWTWVIG
jgi:hypothetical protein